MTWFGKRKRGRHVAIRTPGNGQLGDAAIERATEDLKEAILRRPEVDRLVQLVRQEFGARS